MRILVICALAHLPLLAFAEKSTIPSTAHNAKIGSIDGSRTVSITNGTNSRDGAPGDTLNPEDTISTPPGATMTIVSPEGSVLVVGQKSQVAVKQSDIAIQTLQVDSGAVRGIVSHRGKIPLGKKKFRLLVRTKAAVMGVRGTDFVISADAVNAEAQLHTLEGSVAVANNEQALDAGKTAEVKGGEFVHATPEKIEPPKPFDREKFAENMKQLQPGLEVPPEAPKAPEAPPETPKEEPTQKEQEPRESWKSFQLQIQSISADGGLDQGQPPPTLSGVSLSWNPTLRLLNDWLYLRNHVGFSSLRLDGAGEKHDSIGGLDLRLLLSVELFNHWIVEAGPTFFSWTRGGSSSGSSLVLGYRFSERFVGWIDRVFISAGKLGQSPNVLPGVEFNKDFRIGAGIRF